VPQLHAVAYAAFEDNFASGVDEARGKVLRFLIERDVLADLPADNNPFGPDPALLASIGRGDTDRYHAPVKAIAEPEPDLPTAPTNAAGK
jgi:hypothetical protein